ncbi:hypothetical protein SAMN02799625_04662 [Methylobacterium sp. UNC300MFChir4.1]|uniref:hypothetical protein n=1 Tax=Methylobacterium sp. UNC300MFChir4.1 TaxID=1502747 RepID=UPI0008AA91F9|nr:hypothetical protein [Methylobacterium sp. UNC300MFChir4.1]SEP09720.1 hypothetical protein SAMN02799625_04662 [Methylobacterium sp. UNC300MFChir4.1]
MTSQDAIDALALQNQRFNDLIRLVDDGIWWSSDAAAKLDAAAIFAQVDHIRIALDEITRLANQMAIQPRSLSADTR